MHYNLTMECKTTQEQLMAVIHGDPEYAEVLQGFTRVEKDKAQPVLDKWAMQHIERILRSTL